MTRHTSIGVEKTYNSTLELINLIYNKRIKRNCYLYFNCIISFFEKS